MFHHKVTGDSIVILLKHIQGIVAVFLQGLVLSVGNKTMGDMVFIIYWYTCTHIHWDWRQALR